VEEAVDLSTDRLLMNERKRPGRGVNHAFSGPRLKKE
jgi:hypothetical protein